VLGLVEARDLEEASFALIENRGEDAWRVELRKATPIDRTIHAHQRDRVQVADDAVGLDRLISHFDTRQRAGLNAVRGSFSTFGRESQFRKIAPAVQRADSLFFEKFSLISVWKFPVPLSREFGWKLLNTPVD
jgi:hypothetical protein